MKKLISLILILCMACMLIPAMADVDVTGVWYLKIMAMEGQSYDAAAMGYNIVMNLNADGSVEMTMPTGDVSTGSWTLEGDQITVTVDDAPASGPVTEDAISLAADGQEMIFTREANTAITVGEVVAAESADVFYGDWACKYMESEGMILDPSAFGSVMPGITVTEGTIKFIASSEEDLIAAMYDLLGLTNTFEDGKLVLASSLEGSTATGTLELLDDGMIKMSLINNGDTVCFYYVPAEAAEEPAA